MQYSTIQPPFTLKFAEMSRSELREYNSWFHSMIPHRIAELRSAVQSSPGFETWNPDHTPGSLEQLGAWFQGQVTTRRRTPEEADEIRTRLVFSITVSGIELTNQTLSLAMDVGMYFGQVVVGSLPGAHWDQSLKGKTRADYGQPVVVGAVRGRINPVRVIVMLAYAIAAGRPQAGILSLYESWLQILK